jgi:EmrB/QacA subfamily drug resistance transporter
VSEVHAHKLDASVWKIVAVAMLGSLLAQLDATIINVSLSALGTDLHAPLATIQWVTSGYLLSLAFALPLNGWLVERIGAKALYLWCFAVFTISSALCGVAWSAPSLIGFRLLQGASGGLLAPMAQLMMRRAAGTQFTRIAGYAAIPVLLGPALGPVLAGAILHVASWRWLFLVNLPVGILAIALAFWLLPGDEERPAARRLDWLGLLLLSPSLVFILYGIDRLDDPVGVAATVAGAVLLASFVVHERRKGAAALIDLALFRRRAFSVPTGIQFLWNGAMFAGQMLVPLFLVEACGVSPTTMGWMLAPLGLGMMVTVPSLGFLTSRFGERRVAVAGAVGALGATLVLLWIAVHGLDRTALAAALFVRGMGLGAIGLPVVSLAYAAIEKEALPMATTTLNIVQRIGGPTLTTLCALILSRSAQSHASHFGMNAWGVALLALTALHALMVAGTMMLPTVRASVRKA